MKRFITCLSACLVIFALCFTFASSAFAANNITYAKTGNLSQTVKFSFSTGSKIFASDKVVLRQHKGSSKQIWGGKVNNYMIYGQFTINVYDETDKKWVYKDKKWQDGQFTLTSAKLKKNHNYSVTIEGYNPQKYPGLTYNHFLCVFQKWNSYPRWYIHDFGGNVKMK